MKKTIKAKKKVAGKTCKCGNVTMFGNALTCLTCGLPTPIHKSKNMGEFKVYKDPNLRIPVLLNWPAPHMIIGPAIVNIKAKG